MNVLPVAASVREVLDFKLDKNAFTDMVLVIFQFCFCKSCSEIFKENDFAAQFTNGLFIMPNFMLFTLKKVTNRWVSHLDKSNFCCTVC